MDMCAITYNVSYFLILSDYKYNLLYMHHYIYSPFHSSLPFEHLGQSNLFTRVCRLFVNPVTFYSILELKQCPRCQVFLKSIQHLS